MTQLTLLAGAALPIVALPDVLTGRAWTRVVNIRREACDVYVGRPGKGLGGPFGNPYSVHQHGYRALDLFRTYFLERVDRDVDFRAAALALRGKRLGCFCAPGPCHGDVIAAWVDAQPEAGS